MSGIVIHTPSGAAMDDGGSYLLLTALPGFNFGAQQLLHGVNLTGVTELILPQQRFLTTISQLHIIEGVAKLFEHACETHKGFFFTNDPIWKVILETGEWRTALHKGHLLNITPATVQLAINFYVLGYKDYNDAAGSTQINLAAGGANAPMMRLFSSITGWIQLVEGTKYNLMLIVVKDANANVANYQGPPRKRQRIGENAEVQSANDAAAVGGTSATVQAQLNEFSRRQNEMALELEMVKIEWMLKKDELDAMAAACKTSLDAINGRAIDQNAVAVSGQTTGAAGKPAQQPVLSTPTGISKEASKANTQAIDVDSDSDSARNNHAGAEPRVSSF
ncbi:hypothetical protein F5Y13DRAFT_189366 [Hypoxylon sp. FL1857]|nr:hypothetical protein F5Y13DRAFT_189366 [Hypoxylon sp. FL1857]